MTVISDVKEMDLAIVIPVYNEERSIQLLIENLYAIILKSNISYTFFIINDGSTDCSENIINSLSTTIPNIQLISDKNYGHGPSLWKGYNLALGHKWVFQFDSDYQYDLSSLPILWEAREQYDLLVAERESRSASFLRNFVTAILKHLILLLYGEGISDINSPYRLIRANKLKQALQVIDQSSFAPNMLISAFFIKKKFPIYTTACTLKANGMIKKSHMTAYIFKGCIKSIFDLLVFRSKI